MAAAKPPLFFFPRASQRAFPFPFLSRTTHPGRELLNRWLLPNHPSFFSSTTTRSTNNLFTTPFFKASPCDPSTRSRQGLPNRLHPFPKQAWLLQSHRPFSTFNNQQKAAQTTPFKTPLSLRHLQTLAAQKHPLFKTPHFTAGCTNRLEQAPRQRVSPFSALPGGSKASFLSFFIFKTSTQGGGATKQKAACCTNHPLFSTTTRKLHKPPPLLKRPFHFHFASTFPPKHPGQEPPNKRPPFSNAGRTNRPFFKRHTLQPGGRTNRSKQAPRQQKVFFLGSTRGLKASFSISFQNQAPGAGATKQKAAAQSNAPLLNALFPPQAPVAGATKQLETQQPAQSNAPLLNALFPPQAPVAGATKHPPAQTNHPL